MRAFIATGIAVYVIYATMSAHIHITKSTTARLIRFVIFGFPFQFIVN